MTVRTFWISTVIACAAFASSGRAGEGGRPEMLEGSFGAELLLGFERGDYGTGDTVSVMTLSARLLYTWSYGQARLTVPFLYVTGRDPGDDPDTIYGGYLPFLTGAGGGDAGGLGDIALDVDLHLFGRRAEGFSGGPLFGVKFPTADEDDGLGTGEFDLKLGAHAAYAAGDITPFARLTWTRVGDPPGLNLRDPWSLVLGAAYRPDEADTLSAFLEVKDSMVRGQGESATLFFSWRRELTDDLYFMLTPYVGLNDEAPDFGLSVGVGFGF